MRRRETIKFVPVVTWLASVTSSKGTLDFHTAVVKSGLTSALTRPSNVKSWHEKPYLPSPQNTPCLFISVIISPCFLFRFSSSLFSNSFYASREGLSQCESTPCSTSTMSLWTIIIVKKMTLINEEFRHSIQSKICNIQNLTRFFHMEKSIIDISLKYVFLKYFNFSSNNVFLY